MLSVWQFHLEYNGPFKKRNETMFILPHLVSLQKVSEWFHDGSSSSLSIVHGMVTAHTVMSLKERLTMKRLRGTRAWELRTITQQTLMLVIRPAMIRILQKEKTINAINLSVSFFIKLFLLGA